MPGTRAGGLKATKTNKQRYGEGFYIRIGTMGGQKSRGGGFASDQKMASLAGRLGGIVSRKNDFSERDEDKEKEAVDAIREYRRGQYGSKD